MSKRRRNILRLMLPLLGGIGFGLLLLAASMGQAPITVYLAGDSTMAEKLPEKRPETGWGERLQAFFDEADVRIENHARNGRSTRTFIEEGRWQALVDRLQPGDYVFIQFGHNDQSKEKTDRYTPPDQFRANLIRYVQDVRAKQATPVLLTPVVRRRFDDEGQFYDVHGIYPDLTRSVAITYDVPLLDVHRRSEAVLRAYGEEGSKALFLLLAPGAYPNYPEGLDDNTHFSPHGAEVMARLAIEELRKSRLELASFLKEASEAPAASSFDAVVDAAYTGAPGARVDGAPTYRTIAAALDDVPADNAATYRIFIRAGRYYEKLSVDKPNVQFIGEDRDGTVITFDASGDTPNPEGGTLGTWGSYTLRIAAPDFLAENLTIENGFDYPANADLSDDEPAKVHNPQGVALMTDTGSDRAIFRDCTISGYQDTLFANAGRHSFHRCRILGHVDFIFGSGQAVFDDCDIISRDREGKDPTGYVAAPSTPISFPYGFLFVDSRLLKETPHLLPGSVRLGRPWHPNADPRANGSAVFLRCFMDDHIGAEGYAPISGRNAAGERIWFEVGPDSRFFEFASYGPGAVISPSRPMLSDVAAAWYTPQQVLNGWEPAVPAGDPGHSR